MTFVARRADWKVPNQVGVYRFSSYAIALLKELKVEGSGWSLANHEVHGAMTLDLGAVPDFGAVPGGMGGKGSGRSHYSPSKTNSNSPGKSFFRSGSSGSNDGGITSSGGSSKSQEVKNLMKGFKSSGGNFMAQFGSSGGGGDGSGGGSGERESTFGGMKTNMPKFEKPSWMSRGKKG